MADYLLACQQGETKNEERLTRHTVTTEYRMMAELRSWGENWEC